MFQAIAAVAFIIWAVLDLWIRSEQTNTKKGETPENSNEGLEEKPKGQSNSEN